jgi:hypothetical protein
LYGDLDWVERVGHGASVRFRLCVALSGAARAAAELLGDPASICMLDHLGVAQ